MTLEEIVYQADLDRRTLRPNETIECGLCGKRHQVDERGELMERCVEPRTQSK